MAIEGRYRVDSFTAGSQGDPMLEGIASVIRAFAGAEPGVGIFFEHQEGHSLVLTLHHVPSDHPDLRRPEEPTT